MSERKVIEIHSFEDFLSKVQTFLFYHNSIRPEFCLEVPAEYFFKFPMACYSLKDLNNDILTFAYLFQWHKTKKFYYPNTNMFSGDNSEHGIRGFRVTKKP